MKTAAFALALALLALSMGPPPAKVVNYSMTAEGIVEIFLQNGKLQFYFPRVLVFDRDGAYVYGAQGYGSSSAANIMKATHFPAKKEIPRLDAFASFLRDANGKAVDPAVLKGQATIVQLGAAWCKPCHQLEADLRRQTGINLVLVDADPQTRGAELQEALKKRLSPAAPPSSHPQ